MADTVLAESSRKALVEVLGAERRDRILSALFLARQDSINTVRQSSVHIWKALVHNTPRTGTFEQTFTSCCILTLPSVREILPQLITQIIQLLSGDESDQQEVSIELRCCMCMLLTSSRRLQLVLLQNFAESLARRFLATLSLSCALRLLQVTIVLERVSA